MNLKLTKKEARQLLYILLAYADAGAEVYEGTDTEVILNNITKKLKDSL